MKQRKHKNGVRHQTSLRGLFIRFFREYNYTELENKLEAENSSELSEQKAVTVIAFEAHMIKSLSCFAHTS